MFRLATLFWGLLFTCVLALTVYALTRVEEADRLALKAIRERMPVPKISASSLTLYSQHREGLRRDLWATKGDTRLHAIHYSDVADLMANQSNQELIEEMRGVRCLIQEAITDTPKSQVFCSLKAPEAIYDYNRLILQAQQVQFARYQCTGHHLPEVYDRAHLLLSGDAASVKVVAEQDFSIQATGFKGRIVSARRLP